MIGAARIMSNLELNRVNARKLPFYLTFNARNTNYSQHKYSKYFK